jgi:hypothetical protein
MVSSSRRFIKTELPILQRLFKRPPDALSPVKINNPAAASKRR